MNGFDDGVEDMVLDGGPTISVSLKVGVGYEGGMLGRVGSELGKLRPAPLSTCMISAGNNVSLG